MINHKYKCIFIHVIKTAGASVATALKMKGIHNHAPTSRIKKKLSLNVWNTYFKFSFVRNPWDKMVSQYHYNHQGFVKNGTPFKEYIKMFGAGKQISSHPPTHLPYLTNEQGEIVTDFIGRFETLQKDFNTICDKIGAPFQKLQHLNKTDHNHYTEYYDDESCGIVANKFKEDIEMFGYGFGE